MSYIGFCKRGGTEGICITKTEQSRLATVLKTEYLDQYILLPGMTPIQQKKIIEQKKIEGFIPSGERSQYWENNKGAHGWCCRITGEVTQWG